MRIVGFEADGGLRLGIVEADAVIDLQATPDAVAELDRQLRLNESVLRTKVIRPDVR